MKNNFLIKPNSTFLFQGDSITDAGRNRQTDDLGPGYPLKVARYFNAFMSDYNIKFINKGISGNRTIDLVNRWQQDCIDLKPDYLSILIGINDMWRRYDSNDPTSPQDFENRYRTILTQVKNSSDCKIILLEPFLIPIDKKFEDWHSDLDPKIHIIRRLAREFETLYIPLDGIFAELCCLNDPAEFSGDGVHPSDKGHGVIASEIIKRLISPCC